MTNYLNSQIVVDSYTLNLPSSDGTVALTSQIPEVPEVPEWVNNIKVYSINGKELNIWAYPQGGVKFTIPSIQYTGGDYTLPSIGVGEMKVFYVSYDYTSTTDRYSLKLPTSGKYIYRTSFTMVGNTFPLTVIVIPTLEDSIASGGTVIENLVKAILVVGTTEFHD